MIAAGLVVPIGVVGGPSAIESTEKEWTVLMYWDADNNLEFCTEFAMLTWEEAVPTDEDVNLVVMIDILSAEGVWIYDIVGGERRLVETWPELNSSDPATLKDFISYGLNNYPAQKTMLVVQDHGYSWRGLCLDETDGGGIMPVDGLAGALKTARDENDGKGVDLLAFDACTMSTIEVAYELRDAVPYFVASQCVVPFDGLPYGLFLADMVDAPEMSPAEVAAEVVYDYLAYYGDKKTYPHIYPYNQDYSGVAAFDMSKIQALGDAFTAFTEALLPLVADNALVIWEARNAAMVTKWANIGGWEWIPDVYAFIDGLEGVDPALDTAISAWQTAFADALLAEAHSRSMGTSLHGLGFWFPPCLANYYSASWKWAEQFVYEDIGLDIVSESAWVDCLMEYYNNYQGDL